MWGDFVIKIITRAVKVHVLWAYNPYVCLALYARVQFVLSELQVSKFGLDENLGRRKCKA